jgi:LysR family transcriptional activator of mexEF-oprN operon
MPNINDSYVRDFDLNLLRVFVVVAEEGSLTRAASRLYVTQPAISASIRRLTKFIGAELLTRQGHGLVLTARGTALLEAARLHLRQLVAAALDVPAFDPSQSTATVRIGLAGFLEAVLLPQLLARLRTRAPQMQLVVLRVQFHTVAEMLLSGTVDMAVSVADELPRSIQRRKLGPRSDAGHRYVCLYDPRFAKLSRPLTERSYFAQEHVAVSYAGDARGIVEDTTAKRRTVRVSVPAFSYVPDLVDGSNLVATISEVYARHVMRTRPHLRALRLPFELERSDLELLWSRVTEDDAPSRFVRELVAEIALTIGAGRSRAPNPPGAGSRRARNGAHGASR